MKGFKRIAKCTDLIVLFHFTCVWGKKGKNEIDFVLLFLSVSCFSLRLVDGRTGSVISTKTKSVTIIDEWFDSRKWRVIKRYDTTSLDTQKIIYFGDKCSRNKPILHMH